MHDQGLTFGEHQQRYEGFAAVYRDLHQERSPQAQRGARGGRRVVDRQTAFFAGTPFPAIALEDKSYVTCVS